MNAASSPRISRSYELLTIPPNLFFLMAFFSSHPMACRRSPPSIRLIHSIGVVLECMRIQFMFC